jgi:hypothetical protein
MNTNKFLIGGIIGGIAYFLLGWLIYGMLLMDFMSSNTMAGVYKTEADMVWWALIVGNIFSGLVLSYVLNKSGVSTASGGASVGAMLGLLITLAFDLTMYGTSNIFTSMTGLCADVAASIVISAIVGGIIGWYLGMGKKAA